MEKKTTSPVLLYTEQTPNPETLKFVTNRMLHKGLADFNTRELAEEWSPLATALFNFPFVKGVYISNNFVTLTKELTFSWQDIMVEAKEFIKEYVQNDGVIIKDGFADAMAELATENSDVEYSAEDKELAKKIIELIDTYVKPAVEMDGGNIAFKSFHQGVVTVEMQGSCNGCPSSTVTLKSGIEAMLQRMVPEVKEVVATMGA